MVDPSDAVPIRVDRWARSRHPDRRCVAHKKNGDQCGNAARRGTSVCDYHGAKAPQVKAKARQRLEEAADGMAKALLGIALTAQSESVKLAAIKDALDRAGLGAGQALGLAAKVPQPWEEVLCEVAFDGIARGTSDQQGERYGILPEQFSALPGSAEPEVVEAEVVAEGSDSDNPERAAGSPADGLRALDRAGLPDTDSATSTTPLALPSVSVSYEEAAVVWRASRTQRNRTRIRRRS